MKNFKLKPKMIEFTSSKNMTESEKTKIYKDFVKFLNNHFKRTLFSKRLYDHFHLHCGFIAHYNINGFYGEYFYTAAKFHKISSGYAPESEYIGYVKSTPGETISEAFINMFKEINTYSYDGLSGFYKTIMENKNYGGYSDYSDLDNAIKEIFKEYILELNKVINKILEDEESLLLNKVTKIVQEQKSEINQTQILFNNEDINILPIEEVFPKKYIQKSLFDF